MYLHWADIMRLSWPLAHIFLHLVPLSTFAYEEELSDSGGGDLAEKCPWHEPCFDEDTRKVHAKILMYLHKRRILLYCLSTNRCHEMTKGGSCFGSTMTANGTVVHGDVYGAIRTLALCRQSCRRVYAERKRASFFNIFILIHFLYIS